MTGGLSFRCAPIEGKPLFTATKWMRGSSRSPGSMFISYSTREIEAVLRTGDSSDFNAIRKKLDSVNLGGAEVVLKAIADEVAMQDEILASLEEKLEKMQDSLKLLNSVFITERTPSNIVYDCMRVYGDLLTQIYRKVLEEHVGESDRALFGKVIRLFVRKHRKIIIGGTRGRHSDAELMITVNFPAFAAALCCMLKNPGSFKVSLEEARKLKTVLFELYKTVVEAHSKEFPEDKEKELMKTANCDANIRHSIQEWLWFLTSNLEITVDIHCAEGFSGEYEELSLVRDAYRMLIEEKVPVVSVWPTLTQPCLITLDKYIEDKRQEEAG